MPSHWSQAETLDSWLKTQGVPGISGIDTRQLTKMIREKGTMLGRIILGDSVPSELEPLDDPNRRNLVEEVSIKVTVSVNIITNIMRDVLDLLFKFNVPIC